MIPEKNCAYVQGLLRMVSAYARGMSPSVIMALPLDGKAYLKEFAEKFRISGEGLELQPLNETLPEILQRWICEDKAYRRDSILARLLGKQITRRLGQPKLIAGLSEGAELPKGLECEENSAISRTQGVFFAIYKDGVLCFLKGKVKS